MMPFKTTVKDYGSCVAGPNVEELLRKCTPKQGLEQTIVANLKGSSMKHLIIIATLAANGLTYAAESALQVPSDSNAKYFVLEKGLMGTERTIVTKRVGSSGTSFSKRLYNCSNGTVKYIGTGDSLNAMISSKPDPKMSPIVSGSIAYYVGQEACK